MKKIKIKAQALTPAKRVRVWRRGGGTGFSRAASLFRAPPGSYNELCAATPGSGLELSGAK